MIWSDVRGCSIVMLRDRTRTCEFRLSCTLCARERAAGGDKSVLRPVVPACEGAHRPARRRAGLLARTPGTPETPLQARCCRPRRALIFRGLHSPWRQWGSRWIPQGGWVTGLFWWRRDGFVSFRRACARGRVLTAANSPQLYCPGQTFVIHPSLACSFLDSRYLEYPVVPANHQVHCVLVTRTRPPRVPQPAPALTTLLVPPPRPFHFIAFAPFPAHTTAAFG